MVVFLGEEILQKWAIVKGKRKFNILGELRAGFTRNYEWISQEHVLDTRHYSLCLYPSREEAQVAINSLPAERRFADARPMNLTVKLG